MGEEGSGGDLDMLNDCLHNLEHNLLRSAGEIDGSDIS